MRMIRKNTKLRHRQMQVEIDEKFDLHHEDIAKDHILQDKQDQHGEDQDHQSGELGYTADLLPGIDLALWTDTGHLLGGELQETQHRPETKEVIIQVPSGSDAAITTRKVSV